MANEADLGNKAADLFLQQSLKSARADANKQELPRVGLCHNCMEPISQGLYCDALCADDHARRRRVRG